MNFDEDKVDEYTLALLYLVVHTRHEGLGASAWKGFDWDTLNRIHKKGYITNPVGKEKSVGMTEEGHLKAENLFVLQFGNESKNFPFPNLTTSETQRWEQIIQQMREKILKNVWCSKCRTMVSIQVREGRISGRSLLLRGICKTCGSEAVRMIEPAGE